MDTSCHHVFVVMHFLLQHVFCLLYIAAQTYYVIAIFILCMLQLIIVAQPNFTTQRSESPHAYTIVLTNTSVIIFLLQHVLCFLNIVAQTHVIASVSFTLCMLRVIRIAYANCMIQCSEPQNAYTTALTNIFIRIHKRMSIHPNITDANKTADTCNIVSTIILKNITPQTPTDDNDNDR